MELDIDDHYPEGSLESISENSSDGESKARSRSRSIFTLSLSSRSREIWGGIQSGGYELQINLVNEQL